eukprot:Skav232647  [mRNA]  locus=scaffold2334:93032:117087:- [translate_table: standard]
MDEELSKAIEDGVVGPKADPKERGPGERWRCTGDVAVPWVFGLRAGIPPWGKRFGRPDLISCCLMLLLLETPAGYALFSVKNKKLLKADADSIYDSFKTSNDAARQVGLTAFHKFEDTKAAMEACTELTDGSVGKSLKKFLKKNVVDAGLTESLAVLDKPLGVNINKKLGIEVSVMSESLKEIMRGVRMHLTDLIEGLDEQEANLFGGLAGQDDVFGLGSHPVPGPESRFKLKFSPDKGNIKTLSERVIELTEYRASLSEYLKLRMTAIAPNLTYMVGELVGARLISQAGPGNPAVPQEVGCHG